MKYLFSIAIAALSFIMMTSCNSQQKQSGAESDTESAPKALVLYYSQTGATKAVAEQLSKCLNADIEAIELVDPYSGDYNATIQRCLKEMQDTVIPEIKPIKTNLADYDVVFLGYPIWFGTYARPIYGLVAANDFADKKVVPFCTFGSGGLEASAADLAKALPKAKIADGYGVRNARINDMPGEVSDFLIANGYIEGELTPLPDYSAQHEVTPDEVSVFDAACGDYQFPLGTPITVGSRTTDKGTDYKYIVSSKDAQGNDIEATIYVTVAKGDEAKPVFTKVVR